MIVYAVPRPPALDDAILEHPEVKAEFEQSIGTLHRVIPWRDSAAEQLEDLLAVARKYQAITGNVRDLVEPYLEIVGSTQSWIMFGGTPPRFPVVLVVEVRPRREAAFVLFQDLHWGTPDSAAMNFRHRKVHENLYAWEGPRARDAYAEYWADRWDRMHPHRPAAAVRLSFTRLHTPSPGAVRAGTADRRQETGIQPHVWERP